LLKIRIIPVLLLRGNSVVKPVGFQQDRVVGDAIASVKVFSKRFADEMIIIDIDATKNGYRDLTLIKKLSRECIMPLTLGGGISDVMGAEDLFASGADKVSINTSFYSNPSLISTIAARFGSQAVVFSLDVKIVNSIIYAVSHCGSVLESVTGLDAAKKAADYGAGEILLNRVDKDGTMTGYDTDLIRKIADSIEIPLVAVGGCGSGADCVRAVKAGASAVAAGSIFFWVGESIMSIKEHMNAEGLEVRLL